MAADAMEAISFNAWHNHTSTIAAHDAFFLYRVRIGGMNTNRADNLEHPSCPLNGCGQDERDTLPHLLRTCGVMKRVWTAVLRAWAQTNLSVAEKEDYHHAVFSLRAPRLPFSLLQALLEQVLQVLPTHRAALQQAWRVICVATTRQL